VGHDDLALMRAIPRLLAADRRRSTSIDGEFKIQNGKLDASAIKAVPVRFNDINNGSANCRVDVGTNIEVLGKFGKVTLTIPEMNIGTDVGEGLRWMANGFAILFKLEDALVDIVTVVDRNVTVDRLGAPYLGRDVNGEGTGSRAGRRKRVGARVRQQSRQSRQGRIGYSSSGGGIIGIVARNQRRHP
jgi:hypothetical protein